MSIKCSCGKIAERRNGLKFNNHTLDGWVCKACGEIYYDPEQVQRILLLNKLKKAQFKVKIGKIRSNQIIRIPKELSIALNNPKEAIVTLSGSNIIEIKTS